MSEGHSSHTQNFPPYGQPYMYSLINTHTSPFSLPYQPATICLICITSNTASGVEYWQDASILNPPYCMGGSFTPLLRTETVHNARTGVTDVSQISVQHTRHAKMSACIARPCAQTTSALCEIQRQCSEAGRPNLKVLSRGRCTLLL